MSNAAFLCFLITGPVPPSLAQYGAQPGATIVVAIGHRAAATVQNILPARLVPQLAGLRDRGVLTLLPCDDAAASDAHALDLPPAAAPPSPGPRLLWFPGRQPVS